VDVYVAKPADYPHAPCKLLLLLTGGTGIHSSNNQIQADKFAAEGYVVVMPDQYVSPLSLSPSSSPFSPFNFRPSIVQSSGCRM
jgi:dienelactone hydrolase